MHIVGNSLVHTILGQAENQRSRIKQFFPIYVHRNFQRYLRFQLAFSLPTDHLFSKLFEKPLSLAAMPSLYNLIIPLGPLLPTTAILVHDINEFIILSTLQSAFYPEKKPQSTSRALTTRTLPTIFDTLARKNALFHSPLHLLTMVSLITCLLDSPPVIVWWSLIAALLLEIGHFVFAIPALD